MSLYKLSLWIGILSFGIMAHEMFHIFIGVISGGSFDSFVLVKDGWRYRLAVDIRFPNNSWVWNIGHWFFELGAYSFMVVSMCSLLKMERRIKCVAC